MQNPILSIEDIADRFSISRTTLWHWRRRGHLPKPTFQMGRRPYWDAAELTEFLKNTANTDAPLNTGSSAQDQ
ncbi:helix-turn-helix domain-containing protein [Luminiphilus sp.]|nr:helix-turn-helix domain-containing protein [Luminiphilus sp.]MDA9711421.1 helix-turn-helix domain-containing protein [Luminiphilus sp.]